MPANDPIAISEKMVTYLRKKLGKDVPTYRDIVLWDDNTFQIKVVHTFDSSRSKKKRVYLLYTSSSEDYKLVKGNFNDYFNEAWEDTTVEGVPNEAVEEVACSKKER